MRSADLASSLNAEFQLRSHWTAVERLAGYLRDVGELKPPYARELVRTALDEPQQVLASDLETFVQLCATLENVPEFADAFTSAVRTLSVQAA